MSITTTIPSITGYSGTVPDKATQTKTDFANSINPYLTYVDNTFVPSYETAKTALNSFATEANALATQANTDASTATTQAGIATTQAGLADTARISAELAKTQAEAIYDNFDDRYLGAKASAPTLDNDGNALQSGALYYNTTSDTMFVYDLELTTWIALTFTPTDHGSLTGLADDDHTQYHNDTRGDARYLQLAGGVTTGAITSIRETSVAMGAVDIDCATGNVFTKTISGASTLTVSNVPATGQAYSFVLKLTNGGSATVTWFGGVKWAGGTAPTLTASGVDAIGFITHDGGTTWYGFKMGLDLK